MFTNPAFRASFGSLLLLSLFPHAGIGQAPEWRLTAEAHGWALQRYTIEDGLPQNSVNDLLLDGDGYLWIATFGGLSRFDGVRFINYDLASDPALPGVRILSLHEDPEGQIWVGLQEGNVAVLRNGVFEEVLPAGRAGQIFDLDGDEEGRIWVASEMGVGVLEEDGEIRSAPGWPSGQTAQQLVVSRDTVWVRGPGLRVVAALDLSGQELFSVGIEGEWGPVSGPQPGLRGSVLFSTARGLAMLAPGGFQPVSPSRGIWEGVDDAARWALGGRLYYGSTDGASRPLGPASLPLLDPLPATIRAGIEDGEGGVWLGSRGEGLFHLSRPLFSMVTGIQNPQALAEDSLGNVWVAACGPSLFFVTTDLEVRSLPDPGRIVRCFRDVVVDSQGDVWIGGSEGRIRRIRGGVVDLVDTPARLSGLERFFLGVGTPRIWDSGELLSWQGDGWRQVLVDQPSREMRVSSVLDLGASGGILGTEDGRLLMINDEKVVPLTPDSVGSPFAIRGMLKDPGGRVWIGTYGNGLKHWSEGESAETLGPSDGLAENVAIGLLMDDNGHLWVSGNLRLSRLSLDELNAYVEGRISRIQPAVFGAADGFMEGNGVKAVKTRDGRLWFPGIVGITVVDPSRLAEQGKDRTVLLERITGDGKAIPLGAAVLESTTREIQVEYTLPAFSRPENTRFRYRLLGLNEEWTDAGTRRTAFFSRLPPGRFTFQVEAVSLETGARSLADLPIRVSPTVYQAFWFRALVIVTLLGVLFLLVHLRLQAVTRRALESERHALELQREMKERMRLQEEKEALSIQLLHAQKMEAVGRLTGGIAHDFNNLLTTIMGHLDLLQMKAGEAVANHVSAAFDAAVRAGNLTKELLTFSRRSTLEPAETDIRALLERMRPLLQPALKANIRMEIESDPDLWSCHIDPNRLENAVLNLCINARDAMPDGGFLHVSLCNLTLDPEAAGWRDMEAGDYVQLEIRDSGTGIPSEILGEVMDPFFTTKGRGKGTGLGLSMAFGFARQSGGHLELESEEGVGTTVRLFLPKGTGRDEAPSQEDLDVPNGSGEQVLVIEDDEALRAITQEYLRVLQYRSVGAATAEEARDLLLENPDLSLVLCDIILPGESGLDLAEDLRRWRPELPVLLVSGTGDLSEDGRGRMVPEGWTGGFLAKPFTRRALGEAIHRVLNGV